MVTLNTEVHWLQAPDGQRRYVDEKQFKSLSAQGWKSVGDVPDPLNSASTLLTLHTHLAVLTGLASGQAPSIEALLATRHLHLVAKFQPDLGERLLTFLSSGPVRMVLLMIFLTSLYIFLHAPGHGAAEAVALISIGLLLGAPLLTGYATWWEVVMIFVGLGLVAFELFVLPHMGIMIVVGIVMMLVGMLLTFVGFEPHGIPGLMPTMQGTWRSMEHGLFYMVGGLVGSVLLMVWFGRNLPNLPMFNRLVIKSPAPTDAFATLAAPPVSLAQGTSWPAIGTVGRAITPLKPGGSAEFYDPLTTDTRVVSVVSEAGFVQPNTQVMVRAVDGSSVRVRAV
jgi:membrane-bound serine protease (ClpP class)